MKLLFCKRCLDIVHLRFLEYRCCSCTATGGMYHSSAEVVVHGDPGCVFGIGNGLFFLAYQEKATFSGWFYGDLVPDHDEITYVDGMEGVRLFHENKAPPTPHASTS